MCEKSHGAGRNKKLAGARKKIRKKVATVESGYIIDSGWGAKMEVLAYKAMYVDSIVRLERPGCTQ
jgi:hypothetical protein